MARAPLLLAACFALALGAPTSTSHETRRRLLGRSTSYCYPESPDTLNIGCQTSLPVSAPACTIGWSASESEPLCALGDNRGGVDENRWDQSYKFDFCSARHIYVMGDSTEYYFCSALESTGDWSTRRRPSNEAATGYRSGWFRETRCRVDPRYSWIDGECLSDTRYLGERCWDGGECKNSGIESYAGLRMSCAIVPELGFTTPTCIPAAFEIERNQCECGWLDWYFVVACGAANDECNGHSCVLSTGDGNHYCDYNTDNDW